MVKATLILSFVLRHQDERKKKMKKAMKIRFITLYMSGSLPSYLFVLLYICKYSQKTDLSSSRSFLEDASHLLKIL